MKTASNTPPSIVTEAASFIGIDCHKKYSVWHAIDAAGSDLSKGRIEHHSLHEFVTRVGEGVSGAWLNHWGADHTLSPSAGIVMARNDDEGAGWNWLARSAGTHDGSKLPAPNSAVAGNHHHGHFLAFPFFRLVDGNHVHAGFLRLVEQHESPAVEYRQDFT